MTETEYFEEVSVLLNCVPVYVQLRMDHVRFFHGDCDSAAILCFMLNLVRMKHENPTDQQQLREGDLFFLCPATSICSKFNMPYQRYAKGLKTLLAYDVIEVEHRRGNLQWVRISPSKIKEIELLDLERYGRKSENRKSGSPKIGNPEVRKSEIPIYPKNPSKNPSNPRASDARESSSFPGFFGGKGNATKEMEYARHLLEILTKARKAPVKQPPSLLKTWAKQLIPLCQNYSHSEVEEVLAVYAKRIGQPYIPEAYCAKSFVTKFPRLQSMVEKVRQEESTAAIYQVPAAVRAEYHGASIESTEMLEVEVQGGWQGGRFKPESEPESSIWFSESLLVGVFESRGGKKLEVPPDRRIDIYIRYDWDNASKPIPK